METIFDIGTESVIFGRTAMGEIIRQGSLMECWRIKYDNRLIFADGLKMHGNIDEQLQHAAVADGMRAYATLLYVGVDAEQYEADINKVSLELSDSGVRAACSLLPNIIIIRILAISGLRLRRALTRLLQQLISQGSSDIKNCLPRIWTC